MLLETSSTPCRINKVVVFTFTGERNLHFLPFHFQHLTILKTLTLTSKKAMDETPRAQAVCGQEALNLLNCVTDSAFDQDKCLRFLQALRDCVLNKVPSTDRPTVLHLRSDL